MRAILLSVAAAAVLLPLCMGCSSQRSQVARGQGPSGTYVTAYGDQVCNDDCDPACRRRRCRFCGGCGCPCCRPYCVPNDLSYPPDGTNGPAGANLPAIVQYPYYTCKGPDCFFKKD